MSNKKNPWEAFPSVWRNSSAFFTYLRGCLRKAWNNSPVKHEYIKKNRKQIPNPNPKGHRKTVWGFTCEMCNEDFPIKECQVDHIVPAGSLNSKEDIQGFVERLLWITDDDIRLCCKFCNAVLSYQDKYNLTWQEACMEKKYVIPFSKLSSTEQIEELEKYGVKGSNAKERKEMYRNIIKQQLEENL